MNESKEQEREALEKIREIIESIGGYRSHIGRAFDGVFTMAENNLCDDAWDSVLELQTKYNIMQQEARILENVIRTHWIPQAQNLKSQLADKEQTIEGLISKMDSLESRLYSSEHLVTLKNKEIEQLKIRAREADEAEKVANVLIEKHNDMAYRLNKAEAENVRKDYEIEDLQNANAKMADEKEEETLSFFEKNSYLQTSLDIAREKLRIAGNEFESMEAELAQVADEKNAEIKELKTRAREADEAEKTVQALRAKVAGLTAQLTTAESIIRTKNIVIEDIKQELHEVTIQGLIDEASPMFEDSDGEPMDVDEMAYRFGVCEKRLDDKNAEIIRLKAQLYDYQNPHDD